MTAVGWKRQFAAPTAHGILTVELTNPARSAVVTEAPLALTALDLLRPLRQATQRTAVLCCIVDQRSTRWFPRNQNTRDIPVTLKKGKTLGNPDQVR